MKGEGLRRKAMKAMSKNWTANDLLELGRGYQAAAVFAGAAELEIFDALANGPLNAMELARKCRCDQRGIIILMDALAALRLMRKQGDRYSLPAGTAKFLTSDGPQSILAMAQHQANCLRNWSQLAKVVKTGQMPDRTPSVRGQAGDAASFIGAMHNVSAPAASEVIRAVRPLRFNHLLDIGGASGTWTIAFLRACTTARATLFDLSHVIPMARQRFAKTGLARRVKMVPGNFMTDTLPAGADLAWVSAIVHQNSRAQNRALFAKTLQALTPGGRIAIRDILMDRSHTRPVSGALFAINMLVATAEGGTFTFDELREDLAAAGFAHATVMRRDETMNSVVVATKPER